MDELTDDLRIERVSNGYILYDGYSRQDPHSPPRIGNRYVFETFASLSTFLNDNFNLPQDAKS